MKRKLNLQSSQTTNLKFKVIAGASSILLLVIAMLFVLNVGNVRNGFATPSKKIVTTVKDGNWTDNSIWNGGAAPTNYSSDSIVILNKINFNTDFTVGDNSKTGIYIGATGTLTGNGHTLNLQKSASLVNVGTLTLNQLNFYGNGATDPASYLTNSGTMTLKSGGLLSYNLNTVIVNSGTLTVSGGGLRVDGTLTNSGTITVTGNFDSDNGKITNSGSISSTGTSTFTNATITNTTASSSITFGGNVALNGTAGGSKLINSGNMTISSGSLTINDGSVTNGPKYTPNNGASFNINGGLTINGGKSGDTTSIMNNGIFTVSQSATVYAITNITNNDSLTISGNFTNYANLVVTKLAYLGIGGDFYNDYGTNAATTINDGYIQVTGNFTNNWNAIFTGSGGGISVGKNFVNHSNITGTVDVCDKTPNTSSDANGNMTTTVTTCSFVAPATGPSALPVELTAFTAKNLGLSVELKWTTASEINNDRFEVERSENGADFSVIGVVKGNGTKNTTTIYAYADENPLNGIAYYRLHQFDFNGKSEYSPIAVVRSNATLQGPLTVNVFPNPAQAGSTIKLELNVPVSEMLGLKLFDMNGTSVYQNESQVASGLQYKNIFLPANLKEGLYILQVVYQGSVTTKKIQIKG